MVSTFRVLRADNGGVFVPLPKELQRLIWDGVVVRNKLVHTGRFAPTQNNAESARRLKILNDERERIKFLLACRDLLLLLEASRGDEVAKDRMHLCKVVGDGVEARDDLEKVLKAADFAVEPTDYAR